MGMQSNRRKFLKSATVGGVAVAASITGFPGILRVRSAHAANEVAVGSLLDQTGALNIEDCRRSQAPSSQSTKSTATAACSARSSCSSSTTPNPISPSTPST